MHHCPSQPAPQPSYHFSPVFHRLLKNKYVGTGNESGTRRRKRGRNAELSFTSFFLSSILNYFQACSYFSNLRLQLFGSLSAPQVAPASFQGINSSSTSIVLRWDPIPEDEVAGVLRSFYITYRQLGTADNTTYNITVPITNVTVEITNLRKYTNYSLDVTGVTKFLGAATEPIIITTGEDGTSDVFVPFLLCYFVDNIMGDKLLLNFGAKFQP